MNYLYHISEYGGIKIFNPRSYWHINYSLSGRVKEDRPIPIGSELFNVVYGKTEENLSFYFLPRETPRLWLTNKISGNKIKIIDHYLETDKKYQALFVGQDHQEIILNHTFFKYVFELIKFTELPNGEWVSFEPVIPLKVLGPLSSMGELKRNGVELIFVKDLNELKMKLIRENINFHFEDVIDHSQ